jgi:hypothetical protein
MKVGIMQPYFFPYIGYWQLINAVDKFVIYDDVNYIRRGWIARNHILINDEAGWINISVKKTGRESLINEVGMFDYYTDKVKIMKKLERTYGKAPFFHTVYPVIKSIVDKDGSNLADYLVFTIKRICCHLGIETDILISSAMDKNDSLKGQNRIIDICSKLGASEYINPIGGTSLYSWEDFNKSGIDLGFIKCNDIKYKQFNKSFVPNLSIIDVLMFNSPEKLNEMIDDFRIVSPIS